MNTIATSVNDSFSMMRNKLKAEKLRPDHAMDHYFYRSHLVYEQELEHLIFKSWIYALHVSEIPSAGDYKIVEIGEDSIIVVRTETGDIQAMHNICRHRGSRVCEELSGNKKLLYALITAGSITWTAHLKPPEKHTLCLILMSVHTA